MKQEKRIVWGICSTIRVSSYAKWRPWVGPIGVFAMTHIPAKIGIKIELSGRPYFFRTRAEARKIAKAKTLERNKTWTWCKYKVKKYQLSWEEVQ